MDQSMTMFLIVMGVVVVLLGITFKFLKPFFWRMTWCLLPLAVGILIVMNAWAKYQAGQGGFKLGVDLAGGTDLIYEIDMDKFPNRELPKEYKPEQLVESLKRRIDPADLYNIKIRPVSNTRVEIVLPTGGRHQIDAEESVWQTLLDKVREKWPAKGYEVPVGNETLLKDRVHDFYSDLTFTKVDDFVKANYSAVADEEKNKAAWGKLLEAVNKEWPAKPYAAIGRGNLLDLQMRVRDQYPELKTEEFNEFIADQYAVGKEGRSLTGAQVEQIKEKIRQVGSLEFRILANSRDDEPAIKAAREYFEKAKTDPAAKRRLQELAELGQPPDAPTNAQGGDSFPVTINEETTQHTYSWVELGKSELHSLRLNTGAKDGQEWKDAETARKKGETYRYPNSCLMWSREIPNPNRLQVEDRGQKSIEYFILTRDSLPGQEVTGQYLVNAWGGTSGQGLKLAVHFRFNNRGANLFRDLTQRNRPSAKDTPSEFLRHLAIVLDGQIMSAPVLQSAIPGGEGEISGSFTQKEVDRLVSILRSGALPATLKPEPVSNYTIGSTLGADTIRAGTLSVGVAFAAVIVFMIVYYWFAGFVASSALLANLLLTIAFMAAVDATFTLPGLAGLVLMVGMAVDANVLIYERFREERDRGASIQLAIRNGYDRAFPTIIDTHLSSIFTAVVLYAVGNDQLKGFGVSLTVGLIISLFTALYMTRLIFDIWLAQGWLTKLRMLRLLAKPNLDFMRIRNYWFAGTAVLTVLGATLFIFRLGAPAEGGAAARPTILNIDFTGGTSYTGLLDKMEDITTLRDELSEKQQETKLAGAKAKLLEDRGDGTGTRFEITYPGNKVARQIELPNPASVADVEVRAAKLPDLSVEQIFLPDAEFSEGNQSRLFKIRTSERSAELVEAAINQLIGDKLEKNALRDYNIAGDQKEKEVKVATLEFEDPENKTPAFVSPGQVGRLLSRAFETEASKLEAEARKLEAKARELAEPQARELEEKARKLDVQAQGLIAAANQFLLRGEGADKDGRFWRMRLELKRPVEKSQLVAVLKDTKDEFAARPQPEELANFDSELARETRARALYAILASWGAMLLYLWFRFGNWTFGLAAVLCLVHDVFFTLGIIACCHYISVYVPGLANLLLIQDFKLDLGAVAAILTLVGFSVNDTIVVFDRIREVRGKNPELTPQMINDSVNQCLSRTLITSFIAFLVVIVLYIWGGEGVHLFSFTMVVGVVVGTYSSIYVASPLLLMFGEGTPDPARRERQAQAAAEATV